VVTLRVGQPTTALLDRLSQFGSNITFDNAAGRIQLTLGSEEEIPQLVNWLVSENHNIYELSPKRLSLEDRFLQIVGDQMYDA
jgi:ABC-2 type transport system ATP-binding protein